MLDLCSRVLMHKSTSRSCASGKISNNEAWYVALLSRLNLARELGILELVAYNDL